MSGVLLTSILFVLTGWTIVRRLDREATFAVLVAESFLVGALAQAVTLYSFSEAGVTWSRALLFVAPLVALVASHLLAPREPERAERRAGLGIIEISALGTVALLHALFATIAPVGEWDFLGIWGVKGNVFFVSGGVDWAFLEAADNSFSNPDYPLLLPITYAISAMIHGGWEDRFLALFTTFFGIAAAVIALDGTAVRRASLVLRVPAAITLTLVAFSDRIGLAEAPLIAFTIAALLRIREGISARSRASLVLGALFLGAAAWTKNEGVALLAAVLAGLVVAGAWRALLHMWPAVVLGVAWQVARGLHELPTARARGDVLARVKLHIDELERWSPQLWTAMEKPAFWFAILFVLIVAGAHALWRERFLVTTFFAQCCAIAAAYLVSHVDLALELQYSWERITHQLALLVVVIAVLAWNGREADGGRASRPPRPGILPGR